MADSPAPISLAAPVLTGNEARYVNDCLDTNWVSSKGRYIPAFEESFSSLVGAKFGVAVSSGTAALHVALAALGVREGDEVIVPTFTMISCANAIRYLGAKPVLVDSEEETWNIDPQGIRSAISPCTKAVMPVHIYGHPADMAAIRDIASEHNLLVVEDAAEAHGAQVDGAPVGSLGDVGAFSFYANKIVTCGEGGMIVTNQEAIAQRAAALRDQCYVPSRRRWLVHDGIGYNYRLTNLQAAIGLAQTERLSQFVDTHRSTARLYASKLVNVPGVTLPGEATWAKNVYWMYTVLIDPTEYGLTRDELMNELEKERIDSRSVFMPIHQQPAYKTQFEGQSFPVAERLSAQGLNLPSGNNTTPREVERVCSVIEALSRR